MAGNRNHYEKAFSRWLAASGLQAMAVDERARPRLADRELKNFDFLVNGADTVYALDLKGRQGTPWITRDDLFSLMAWRRAGRGALTPALVFAFYVPGSLLPARLRQLPALRLDLPTGIYLFSYLGLADTQRLARPRSRRWHTYGFEWAAFCKAAQPIDLLLLGATGARGSCLARGAQAAAELVTAPAGS